VVYGILTNYTTGNRSNYNITNNLQFTIINGEKCMPHTPKHKKRKSMSKGGAKGRKSYARGGAKKKKSMARGGRTSRK
jgi:hypothetical protein